MLLLIDNYDSFTYNLVQRIGELDPTIDMRVVRNDKITVDEARALQPGRLLLSPGPCTPRETGVCPDLIRAFQGRIPILGVCLGHQTIADVHGMTVGRHDVLMHGKTSSIHHDGQGIFAGLADPITATRYHSLTIARTGFPEVLEVTAETEDGVIMGLRHRELPIEGVQFHPESILTGCGKRLLANFLERCGDREAA